MRQALPHVVIVGGGFAGLAAVRALRAAPVRITLVDRGNHHLFQPMLYQVATAGLSAPDIAAPLRQILRRQKNVVVRMATVARIEAADRCLELAGGERVAFDYLLLASGSTQAYFGNDHWAAHAPGLETLDDALDLRRRLLLAFERAESATDPAERDAWLSFAVVGGGPTGVELAGTLAEIARHTLQGEFRNIDPARARVRLVEAGPRVLAGFDEGLSRARANSSSAWAWTWRPARRWRRSPPRATGSADVSSARAPWCGRRASRPRRWEAAWTRRSTARDASRSTPTSRSRDTPRSSPPATW